MPTVEVVLNKPLSGLEVREIILAKLKYAMECDTRLADYIAVPAFRFRLDLAIMLSHAVEANVEITREGGEGKLDELTAHAVTVHTEQNEMPPNAARVDAGIGVPVLTADEKGRPVEREIKYAKERLRHLTEQQSESAAGYPGTDDTRPSTVHIPTVTIPGVGSK